MLSDIWSLGISLIEMAIGSYPIPMPSESQIDEEMTHPPAGISDYMFVNILVPTIGTLPPRPNGNPYASHANAVRMPIFELLQIIFNNVSSLV